MKIWDADKQTQTHIFIKPRSISNFMEFSLQASSKVINPPIFKLLIHNEDGEGMFSLTYDKQERTIKYKKIEDEEIVNQLIKTKTLLTTERGIEAYGSFISGAENETPTYRHLVSLYFREDQNKFKKIHVTVDTKIPHLGLQNSFLFSSECYAVLYQPIMDYMEYAKIDTTSYPSLIKFFFRSYDYQLFSELLAAKETNVKKIPSDIAETKEKLNELVLQHKKKIDGVTIYITTISGAIISEYSLLGELSQELTIRNMTHSSLDSPGVLVNNGFITQWFPFTKNRVGKVSRAIDTTLNTFTYASSNKEMKEQVQTNIAYKFHDLLEVMTEYSEQEDNYGLQTNVGYLVCSIQFKKEFTNQLDSIFEVTQQLTSLIKSYGQKILAYIAQHDGFQIVK